MIIKRISLYCDNNRYLKYVKNIAIVFREIIRTVRDKLFLVYKKRQVTDCSKEIRFFVLGTEDYGNLGDHHIAISILGFLRKNYPETEIYEVSARSYYKKRKELISLITPKDIIIMAGGGNFGNVYETAQKMRRDIIDFWSENLKIVMPVTIFYEKNRKGTKCLYKDVKNFCKERNVVVCTREKMSYEIAQKRFSCMSILTPDIVFSSEYEATIKQNQVLMCLRSDVESVVDFSESCQLRDILDKYFDTVIVYDTQRPHDIKISQRNEEIKKCIEMFAASTLVITDRLHGMIFSAITGTPCFVLNNYNYKIKGCYEWVQDLEYIVLCDDIRHIENMLNTFDFDKEYQYSSETFKKNFEKITSIINYERNLI